MQSVKCGLGECGEELELLQTTNIEAELRWSDVLFVPSIVTSNDLIKRQKMKAWLIIRLFCILF